MLKVKHSKSKRIVLLDFSGEIGKEDIKLADAEVGRALEDIGKGYTLIEVFHHHPRFTPLSGRTAGDLASKCYSASRIWRVIRVEDSPHADPGMSILHRTRWPRDVPELEMDNVREAVEVAKEETREQEDWIVASPPPYETLPTPPSIRSNTSAGD